MRPGAFPYSLIAIVVLCLCGPSSFKFSFSERSYAQSDQQQCNSQRPNLKNFGATLKRLYWDATKQQAVENAEANNGKVEAVEDTVRVNTDLVVLDAMVLDKQQHPVGSLAKSDFILDEDGQPQNVTHFSLGNQSPLGRSIVIIIDHSGSLLPYVDRSVDAAKLFIDKLAANDRVAIVTNEVKLLAGFTCDKQKLKKALEDEKITALTHRGNSYPFSALLATARELFDAEDVRPIIIFQTDGDQIVAMQPPDAYHVLPYKSMRRMIVPFSLDDVSLAVERSRATIYGVIPGFRLMGVPKADQLKRAAMDAELQYAVIWGAIRGDDYLSRQPYHPSEKTIEDNLDFRLKGQLAVAEVAKRSGGWTSFLEEPEQADAIYSNILADINSRYVIGYYPTNKARDGKRRQISVTVKNHPEYTVGGRKSYLAAEK
jgi:VWFA-related protein